MRVRRVHHLEQDVGAVHLLERRAERVDQLVRELVDEADRVRHDDGLALAQLDHPTGRVQRGEEPVLGPRHLRSDQRVEQRGLARVRVADDAHRREQPAVPTPRGRRPLLADLLDPLFHLLDPLADDPPVRLELALARAAGPDAATGPRQVRPEAGEPRQLVLELRELHLEATLVRARVLGEDVQDQPAAIDDLDVEERLEGFLLGG